VTPLAITRTRRTGDPAAFLMAYTAATQSRRWDTDIEALIVQALRDEQYAKLAGLLEGVATLHAKDGWPTKAAPVRRPRTPLGRFVGGAA
jgi:hypothetical protein